MSDMTEEEYKINCDINYVYEIRSQFRQLKTITWIVGWVKTSLLYMLLTVLMTFGILVIAPFIEYKCWRFRKKSQKNQYLK